jgi:hypothetical protein
MSWTAEDWKREDEKYERSESSAAPSIYYPFHDGTLDGAMFDYLEGRGLSFPLAVDYGWYPAYYNGPRVIVPCIRTDSYNFWQGRLIELASFEGIPREDFEWKRWDSPSGPRGDALCFLPVQESNTIVLVEGPMDALAAAEAGASAVAILGATPPRSVVGHIVSLVQRGAYRRRIIVPDLDAVGPWVKLQQRLGMAGVYFQLKMDARYKDLASMPLEERKWLLE